MIFLPYPDYQKTAAALAEVTLNHEIFAICELMECVHQTERSQEVDVDSRLLSAWQGHEVSLIELGLTCLDEFAKRGKQLLIRERMAWHMDCATSGEFSMEKPAWVGDDDIHTSHKAKLIRDVPEYYLEKFPGVDANLSVVWP